MAAGLAEPMAKKTNKPQGKPSEGKTDPLARRNVVSIRGTEAWRDWLTGLASHRRLKASDVIDQALIEYAIKHGYNEPPPKR